MATTLPPQQTYRTYSPKLRLLLVKYFDAGPLHRNLTNVSPFFLMLEVSFPKYNINIKLQEESISKWKKNLKNKRSKLTKQEHYDFYFSQYQTPVILFNVLLTKFCLHDQTVSRHLKVKTEIRCSLTRDSP